MLADDRQALVGRSDSAVELVVTRAFRRGGRATTHRPALPLVAVLAAMGPRQGEVLTATWKDTTDGR